MSDTDWVEIVEEKKNRNEETHSNKDSLPQEDPTKDPFPAAISLKMPTPWRFTSRFFEDHRIQEALRSLGVVMVVGLICWMMAGNTTRPITHSATSGPTRASGLPEVQALKSAQHNARSIRDYIDLEEAIRTKIGEYEATLWESEGESCYCCEEVILPFPRTDIPFCRHIGKSIDFPKPRSPSGRGNPAQESDDVERNQEEVLESFNQKLVQLEKDLAQLRDMWTFKMDRSRQLLGQDYWMAHIEDLRGELEGLKDELRWHVSVAFVFGCAVAFLVLKSAWTGCDGTGGGVRVESGKTEEDESEKIIREKKSVESANEERGYEEFDQSESEESEESASEEKGESSSAESE